MIYHGCNIFTFCLSSLTKRSKIPSQNPNTFRAKLFEPFQFVTLFISPLPLREGSLGRALIHICLCSVFEPCYLLTSFLAQLISCAITNHSSGRDCCCWYRHRCYIPRVRFSLKSSIYHRHIEHFFHIFGGSTVFSLISELARRL